MKDCRRWRRRPANLVESKKDGWLATHLWHAKRCKMTDYWGFKVAAHLNEKCLKSSFRSSQNGALLHDSSYWRSYQMEFFDSELFFLEFPSSNSYHEVIIEHERVQICPIKILLNMFQNPIIFIHPAAVVTGILDHPGFMNFLEKFKITLKPTVHDICTFSLQGTQSALVLKSLIGDSTERSAVKGLVPDPRISSPTPDSVVQLKIVSTAEFDSQFFTPQVPVKDEEINAKRAEFLIPDESSITQAQLIPIGVIKTATTPESYLIICPPRWSRIIWFKLIKSKPVKVAGINTIEMISFENEVPIYPRDFVSSPAYNLWSEMERYRLESEYIRKPPAKRPAYKKFGIESPFKPDFTAFPKLSKVILEIEGKGIIEEFAEIYNSEKILIGYATTAVHSSLKKGVSTAIGSIFQEEEEFEEEEVECKDKDLVFIRNIRNPDIFRSATVKKIK